MQLRFIENVDQNILLSSGIICLYMMIAFSLLNLLQTKYYLEYRQALESNEKELEQQNKELEKYIKSNIKLEQFAHIAAHDLKSPLRNISSFTGLLKKKTSDKLDSKEIEYLEMIENSSIKMNEFIEDLLIYSKANSQELKRSKFSFLHLVEDVTDNLKSIFKNHGVKIELADCDVIIYADKIKCRQVVQNIITNSIKFRSIDRPLQLEINCMSNDTYNIFTFSDNGNGISDEYKTKVFKEFTQLNPREYEGTGMGLSIVRNIIIKHNGAINLKDNIPYGLTVEIILPIENN